MQGFYVVSPTGEAPYLLIKGRISFWLLYCTIRFWIYQHTILFRHFHFVSIIISSPSPVNPILSVMYKTKPPRRVALNPLLNYLTSPSHLHHPIPRNHIRNYLHNIIYVWHRSYRALLLCHQRSCRIGKSKYFF